jgi:L-seryl-tRNA(Ser) seleniumtransferase
MSSSDSAPLSSKGASDIYETLGIKPIVNAGGHMTILGGSMLSPEVREAMESANSAYTLMDDVFDGASRAIGQMLGTEGGLVTSGCYAALVQGAAAILAGDDPERIRRLPDTTGIKNEFLIQKPTRYRYDRSVTTPGGKLVEVGDDDSCTPQQLRDAIGPQTAGLLYFAAGERFPNTVSLPDAVEIAHAGGIPVLVDAAAEIYPLERMRRVATSGADLVCFGGKYLGSGNSTGILTGNGKFVSAARLNGFTGYETGNNSVGRGYKVDRQEVVGTTVALRHWLETDHEQRLQGQSERISQISAGLAGLSHVGTENMWEQDGAGPWMRLRVHWDEQASGRSADEVVEALRNGSPAIFCRAEPGGLHLAVHTLREGETEIVLRRLQEELG